MQREESSTRRPRPRQDIQRDMIDEHRKVPGHISTAHSRLLFEMMDHPETIRYTIHEAQLPGRLVQELVDSGRLTLLRVCPEPYSWKRGHGKHRVVIRQRWVCHSVLDGRNFICSATTVHQPPQWQLEDFRPLTDSVESLRALTPELLWQRALDTNTGPDGSKVLAGALAACFFFRNVQDV